MPPTQERVLIDRDRIGARVRAMGEEICAALRSEMGEGDEVVMIPVMTGALVFAADLIRAMPVRMSIHPVTVSSYRGKTTRPADLVMRSQTPTGLKGKHVIVVDDILDTGRTLALLRGMLAAQSPASLRICVLLRKDKAREAEVEADLVGFDIPDEFVVGYGLDYDGLERNRPDIAVLGGGEER
ncbi:MAG: hypoxanthine phosphoribosyltransferase [Phycisphaerales bacterium]